jgi:HAE1 family hydrophobic/amphiphilic exporter-1
MRPQSRLAESDPIFSAMLKWYRWSLTWAVRHRLMTLGLAGLLLVASAYLFIILPKGFVPPVDMNYLIGFCISGEQISPEAMQGKLRELEPMVKANENVASVLNVSGHPQRNQGFTIAFLKNRPPRPETAGQVMAQLMPGVNSVPGLLAFYSIPPLIEVRTEISPSPYQFILQCADTATLFRYADKFTRGAYGLPELTSVSSNLYIKNPEVFLKILRDKASSLGISADDIEQASFSSYGEREISNIYASTDTYKVILQVEQGFQRYADQLSSLYLKSSEGQLVRLDVVADIVPRVGPLTVSHYGQLPSVTVSFDTAVGYSLGQATEALKELARQMLPDNIIYRFGGTAEAFETSMKSLTVLLFVAIVVIYMILACLYESFLHPLTIIAGLPSAAFGGLVTLYLLGIQLDLYGYVGIFMLIGIVKKNAIMVVDFALEAQRHGHKTPMEAAVEGSLVRFRPIMMTTIAAIAGMMPIAVGYGAGGDSRQPLGLVVVGGLMLSQVVTLYLTPVVYSYLATLQEWLYLRGAANRSLMGIPEE